MAFNINNKTFIEAEKRKILANGLPPTPFCCDHHKKINEDLEKATGKPMDEWVTIPIVTGIFWHEFNTKTMLVPICKRCIAKSSGSPPSEMPPARDDCTCATAITTSECWMCTAEGMYRKMLSTTLQRTQAIDLGNGRKHMELMCACGEIVMEPETIRRCEGCSGLVSQPFRNCAGEELVFTHASMNTWDVISATHTLPSVPHDPEAGRGEAPLPGGLKVYDPALHFMAGVNKGWQAMNAPTLPGYQAQSLAFPPQSTPQFNVGSLVRATQPFGATFQVPTRAASVGGHPFGNQAGSAQHFGGTPQATRAASIGTGPTSTQHFSPTPQPPRASSIGSGPRPQPQPSRTPSLTTNPSSGTQTPPPPQNPHFTPSETAYLTSLNLQLPTHPIHTAPDASLTPYQKLDLLLQANIGRKVLVCEFTGLLKACGFSGKEFMQKILHVVGTMVGFDVRELLVSKRRHGWFEHGSS